MPTSDLRPSRSARGWRKCTSGATPSLLQDYYVEDWAANCMMHMLVDDVEGWWAHIASLDLPSRYDVKPPRAPRRESWGLDVAYVFDPSGVLWHVAGRPAKEPA